jgi:hypothetical protein
MKEVIKPANQHFIEMLRRQLPNLNSNEKLQYDDLMRICDFTTSSIFSQVGCCLWKGYITPDTRLKKLRYVNFYFNQKKVALHRLLYMNFVEPLSDYDYIKYECKNRGACCNVNHMRKKTVENRNYKEVSPVNKKVRISRDNNKLIVEF